MENDKNDLELLQKEYFEETVKIFDFKKLSDSQVEYLIDKLLNCLPNDKHLYKYRSFSSEHFQDTLINIENGEIFLPQATLLNDKIDCTFNYQTLRTDEEIINYIKSHVYNFHLINLKDTDNKDLLRNKEIKFEVLRQLIKETPIQKIAASIQCGCSYKDRLRYVQEVIKEAYSWVLSTKYLDKTLAKYKDLGEYIRKRMHIFSLCETCCQDSMWAYYSNNNNGYCIEYDFNRIKELDTSIKRQLLSLYKIKYSNYQQPIDALDLFEITIMPKKKHKEKGVVLNEKIMQSFLTKSESWEHEKEWRIILEGEQNIINADLVCGVIIDEDHLDSERSIELINVATKKGISIKVRHLDRKTNSFQIIPFEE